MNELLFDERLLTLADVSALRPSWTQRPRVHRPEIYSGDILMLEGLLYKGRTSTQISGL
jgi:hypothetical protein